MATSLPPHTAWDSPTLVTLVTLATGHPVGQNTAGPLDETHFLRIWEMDQEEREEVSKLHSTAELNLQQTKHYSILSQLTIKLHQTL